MPLNTPSASGTSAKDGGDTRGARGAPDLLQSDSWSPGGIAGVEMVRDACV